MFVSHFDFCSLYCIYIGTHNELLSVTIYQCCDQTLVMVVLLVKGAWEEEWLREWVAGGGPSLTSGSAQLRGLLPPPSTSVSRLSTTASSTPAELQYKDSDMQHRSPVAPHRRHYLGWPGPARVDPLVVEGSCGIEGD